MKNSRILIALGVGILALIVRWPGAGSFMTADEDSWMERSSQYYHNLFVNKDTGGAFMTTHPGATAMWLIGGGITLQEERLGEEMDTKNLIHFRRAATLPIAVFTSFLVATITYLVARLRKPSEAVVAGSLLALDPYLTGISQVAHLDALLALTMLGSAVAFLLWAKERSWSVLLGAGVLAGLALATKLLPALWLFVFVGAYLLYYVFRRAYSWNTAIRTGMFFFGISIVTLYALWPALWKTADVGRSFEKDVTGVVADAHIELELTEEPIDPASFYLRTVAGRVMPVIFIPIVLLFLLELHRLYKTKRISQELWLLIYAAGFLLLVTYIAKKGDRYLMPTLAALPLIVGLGIHRLITYIPTRGVLSQWKLQIAGGVLVVAVLATTVSWAPYTIAYSSPLFPQSIRPRPQQGWGEGLDAAAAWLNQSPFIDRLHVATWYPDVLGTYFDGRAMSLSSREDRRVGYVVIYRNMEGRPEDDIASNVLDEFTDKTPEHVISIQGTPYVWIYNTLGPYYFRQHIGELVGDMEVGQLVPINQDNWSRIDFAIATFSSRNNTQDVIVEVRENIDDDQPIRTATVNAKEILDEEFQAFNFEPISNSAAKTYYVSLRSPTSFSGNAVTVRYVTEDVLPGEMVFRRDPLKAGEKRSTFIRSGDLGYRVL